MFFKILQENKKLKKENELLKKEARTDYLTGLLNRKGIEEKLAEEKERINRYGAKNFSILFLDLDNLKEINDNRGYEEGDRALKRLASIIEENTRKVDSVARVGGDEFFALLPETSKEEAMVVAEKIRTQLRKEKLNASIGVAENKEEAQRQMQKQKRKNKPG